MAIFLKILPIILITAIFYVLIYDLYPTYQQTITLVKKINELENKEKQIANLRELLATLRLNVNIQQLVKIKDNLNAWLPNSPNIDELISSLYAIYQMNGLVFKGTDFRLQGDPISYNKNVLPFKIISFNLSANLNSTNLLPFIEAIENNVRLMVIKRAKLSPTEPSQFYVESYYLSKEKR